MLLTAQRAQLNLADDEVVRLHDACDTRLEVTRGFVWVTVEGERGDVVLGAGESLLIDSPDAVTVSALRGAAALKVRADVGVAARRKAGAAMPNRWRQWLARVALSPVAVA